jgi:hypothetical protein
MGASSFSIKSSSSDRELVFIEPQRDYFVVDLRGSGVRATLKVYAYTDARGLSAFFSRIADYEQPWTTPERWGSLEGEFAIEAKCSKLGHVTFSVRIRDMFSDPEEWEVRVDLATELGQLRNLAAHAAPFFALVASA